MLIKTAKVHQLLIILVILLKHQGNTQITTIPPSPSNVLATGYPGLIMNVQFKQGNDTCAWRLNRRLQFYTKVRGCEDATFGSESSSCVEEIIDGVNYITSNLTFNQPLSSGSLNAYVRCTIGPPTRSFYLPTKTVQDCPKTLSNNVSVESSSNIFNANGRFTCSNNGKLFYSNGNQLQSIETTCLASAKWSGQDNLQCLANYPPYQNTSTTCTWTVNQIGLCDVIFYSNPISEFVSLTANGANIMVANGLVVNDAASGKQTFHYKKDKVTSFDQGTYTLTLKSRSFNDTRLIFTINTTNGASNTNTGTPNTNTGTPNANTGTPNANTGTPNTNNGTPNTNNGTPNANNGTPNTNNGTPNTNNGTPNTTSIIISVVVVVVVLIIGLVIFFVLRRKIHNKSGGVSQHINPTYQENNDHVNGMYAEVDDVRQEQNPDDQEQRSNPLYAPSAATGQAEGSYVEVDLEKNKKSNEERVNPLYAPSTTENHVADTQGNQENPRKNDSKGERVNPLYAPSTAENHVANIDPHGNQWTNDSNEERINPLYAPPSRHHSGVAYEEVDI